MLQENSSQSGTGKKQSDRACESCQEQTKRDQRSAFERMSGRKMERIFEYQRRTRGPEKVL